MSEKDKDLPQTLPRWDVPDSWKWVSIADVGEVITGNTPPTSDQANYGDNIPYVKPPELIDRSIRATPSGLSKKGAAIARVLPAGSVLVSCIGGLGKTGLAKVEVACNQQINAIIFNETIIPEYGFYYSQTLKNWLYEVSSATTLPIVNKSKFLRAPIPIAPLSQQIRIVAEIEKQFSRLDEAVANLKRVKANLKRYKAAVLKAAVEGKLTEEWRTQHPAVEPADKLLERILAERRKAAGKGKYKEPVGPDTSGLPDLPGGWVWTSLDSVIIRGPQNGLYLPSSFYGTGHPILRINDYQQDWTRPLQELQRVRAKPEDISSYSLQHGDIVINRVNSPSHLGKVAVWAAQGEGPIFESNMMRLALSSSIVPRFIAAYLRSEQGRARLTKQAKWAVNQASINQSDVCQTMIPLPPLAEQNQIVAEIERRLSIVAETEAQVDANLRRADRLRQSILKQAFSGQLVSHDPNDEPASVLLQRIRNVVGAIHESPIRTHRKQNRAIHESPLRKTKPPTASADFASLDNVIAAILARMQPGREYSRAEIADDLGLTTGRWNAAIQGLKRQGKVRQSGVRRSATYSVRQKP